MGQPGNIVTNKLNTSMFWLTENTFNDKKKNFSFLNYKNLITFFNIVLKTGLVFTKHIFYNYKFVINRLRFLTLPTSITTTIFNKFYRILNFKNKVFQTKLKKICRTFLNFVIVSNIVFYFFKSWIFLLFVIQIPSNFKKKQVTFRGTLRQLRTSYRLDFFIKQQRGLHLLM
jgi:hypothetical protein